MFKRANKITALLVAAASVMSIVPAMASDRLGTKDGTIEDAVAYSDGKYVYQGYRSNDDDLAVYYNDGSKDKALDDVEDADISDAYADKYVDAYDGGDEYLIDLTNGEVTDDDTPEDRYDNTRTKLKSKLSKTDRYGDIADSDDIALALVGSAKFDENWYQYEADADDTTDRGVSSTGRLYGFTNESGKYIDVSYLANMYLYSTTEGKFVKVENYNDTDSDHGLTVALNAAPRFLAQDKDYIYVAVNVNVYDESDDAIVTGTTTAAAALPDDATATSTVTSRTFIQKISKAQGDDKDDAYLPKTVASYELTKGEFDCDDADDAFDAYDDATDFTVVDGNLQFIQYVGDNVKVTTLNLKKDKVEYKDTLPGDENGRFEDGDKVDAYLVEKNDSDDVDVDDDLDHDNALPYDVDVDGNVWVVADGKIYKFDNNEMTKKYSVDSSLNLISVYDENSMIVWEEDGDIYTTVNEGKAETEAEATPAAPAKVGWDQLADGTWNFYDATGAKVANNWVNVGGAWYYLKADGVMATGWLNDNGTWYYLNGSGAMATGWLNDNGTWYYLNASGAMLANTTVDGYVLGASGAWIK